MSKFPTDPKLREALLKHRTDHSLSNPQLAKALGVGSTFVSKYINDNLDHNPKDFDVRAWDMLKALTERLEMTRDIFVCGFTKAIHGRIDFIRKTADIGYLSSDSGFGKTSAAKLYQKNNPSSIYACLSDRTREGKQVEAAIFNSVENRDWKGNHSRWDFLVERLRESSRVLLIDNAQRLGLSGVRWLCDFRDETECPIVLFVQDGFQDRVKSDPAVTSRMGLAKHLAPTSAEIAKNAPRVVAQEATIEQAQEVSDLAVIVAKKPGHYRAVRKQSLLATILLDSNPEIKDFRTAFRIAHQELNRDYDLPA